MINRILHNFIANSLDLQTNYLAYSSIYDGVFVVVTYKTYKFFWCFTYSTTQFWNSLPNETVLAVKQYCFKALAENFCRSVLRINT